MKNCPNCQNQIPEGLTACPFCGQNINAVNENQVAENITAANENQVAENLTPAVENTLHNEEPSQAESNPIASDINNEAIMQEENISDVNQVDLEQNNLTQDTVVMPPVQPEGAMPASTSESAIEVQPASTEQNTIQEEPNLQTNPVIDQPIQVAPSFDNASMQTQPASSNFDMPTSNPIDQVQPITEPVAPLANAVENNQQQNMSSKNNKTLFIVLVSVLAAIIVGLIVFIIVKVTSSSTSEVSNNYTTTQRVVTTTAKNVSSGNVETLGSYTFTIPEGLKHKVDDDALMVADSSSTMMLAIDIEHSSYETLKNNLQTIKEEFTKQGITVNNIEVKNYSGVEYVLIDCTYDGQNLVEFIYKLDGTDIAIGALVVNGVTYDSVMPTYVNPILKSAKKSDSSTSTFLKGLSEIDLTDKITNFKSEY